MNINVLPSSNNYGWWYVLLAQKEGKQLRSINFAQDTALQAHRAIFWSGTSERFFEVIGKMMSLMMLYNSIVKLPELSSVGYNISSIPNTSDVHYNDLIMMPHDELHRKSRQDIWKYIMIFSRCIMGNSFFPRDSLFTKMWLRVKEQSAAINENQFIITPSWAFREVMLTLLQEDSIYQNWVKNANIHLVHILHITTRSYLQSNDIDTNAVISFNSNTLKEGCYVLRRIESVGETMNIYSYKMKIAVPFKSVTGRSFIKGTLPLNNQTTSRYTKVFKDSVNPFQYLIMDIMQPTNMKGTLFRLEAQNLSIFRSFTTSSTLTSSVTGFEVGINTSDAKSKLPFTFKVIELIDTNIIVKPDGEHVLLLTCSISDYVDNQNFLMLKDFTSNTTNIVGNEDIIYCSRSLRQDLHIDLELQDGILADNSVV
jgi:hypothetical protein